MIGGQMGEAAQLHDKPAHRQASVNTKLGRPLPSLSWPALTRSQTTPVAASTERVGNGCVDPPAHPTLICAQTPPAISSFNTPRAFAGDSSDSDKEASSETQSEWSDDGGRHARHTSGTAKKRGRGGRPRKSTSVPVGHDP
eukprot:scaffold92541_cov22-Tisochrysis_lutea.AAC.2